MNRFILPALVFVFGLCTFAGAADAAKRVALLVGNSQYQNVTPLANPVNDIGRVSDVLRRADFEVVTGINLTRLQLEDTVRTFLRSADGAEIGLFYYSGHGIQAGDQNFIIPVDARLEKASDLEIEAYNLETILKGLQAKTEAQLVFLDACRDFPLKQDQFFVGANLQPASTTRGLARVTADIGSLIVYSTAPGSVAQDGTGDVSPFSGAFARHALEPNREVRQVISDVRRDVMAATAGRQVPWESSSLTKDLFLVRRTAGPIVVPMERIALPAHATAVALRLPVPRHPYGDEMNIEFDVLPEAGHLVVAGRVISAGEQLSVGDFSKLAYNSEGNKEAQVATYTVTDGAGNSARGSVVLSSGSPDAVSPARPERQEPVLPEALLAQRSVPVEIGVGGQALGIEGPPADSAGISVEITKLPKLGVVSVGDLPLQVASNFDIAALGSLKFEPQVGSEQVTQELSIAFRGAGGNEMARASISLQPVLDPCDAEAGEPLDLQGVSKGRLPDKIDPRTAIPACERAIGLYPAVARFRYQLGRAYLAARDVSRARTAVDEAARRGHVRALFEQGYLAYRGIGEAQDAAKAMAAYRVAASRGDPYALYAYGRALYHGDGVAADKETGLLMMGRAADLGHTYAMNELGFIFLSGDGVPADEKRGITLYEAGADRDDIYSLNNLALAYARAQGVPRDMERAEALFRRAINGGHPFAPNELGRLYFAGDGVDRDVPEAVRLYKIGTERGDPWAAANLGYAEMTGIAGEPDLIDAARLYATSVALARGKDDTQARTTLRSLPLTAKAQAAVLLAASLKERPPKNLSDDVLVELAKKAWIASNPRMDLF